MRMEDLCNSTKLSEFVIIQNPAVAVVTDALICLMPKDKLASVEKVFQANLDIMKPFMVSYDHELLVNEKSSVAP